MAQTTATPDHLIDPRLHRLDNLGRAAKRSQSYNSENSVTGRYLWRGPSTRLRLDTLGLDSDNLSQRGTDTTEHKTLSELSLYVQEADEEE